MAIYDRDVTDGACPNCGQELVDIEDEIDVDEEMRSGTINELDQDEEGNWGYS